MARPIFLDEILTFARCSMQHHLRYRMGLPWFPVSLAGYQRLAYRRLVATYFKYQVAMRGDTFAGHAVTAFIKNSIEMQLKTFPKGVVAIRRNEMELAIAGVRIRRVFDAKRDAPIGYDVPVTVDIFHNDEIIQVEGSIPAIFRKDDLSLAATIVMIHAPLDFTSETGIRWSSVAYGFAQAAAKQHILSSSRTEPVEHLPFPIPENVKALPGLPGNLANFKIGVIEAKKGIDAGLALPTGTPARCQECPYSPICNIRLATRDGTRSRDRLLEDLREVHANKPEADLAFKLVDNPMKEASPVEFRTDGDPYYRGTHGPGLVEIQGQVLDSATMEPALKRPPEKIQQPLIRDLQEGLAKPVVEGPQLGEEEIL